MKASMDTNKKQREMTQEPRMPDLIIVDNVMLTAAATSAP